MAKIIQKSDGKGSLKDIQDLVNKNQDLIDDLLKSNINELANEHIIWCSPIKKDGFAEYRDKDFISVLGLDPKEIKLDNFWPSRGPQWDALAKTTSGQLIIFEAKANIPELVSPGTKAGEKSKLLIDKSLNETKTFLGIINDVDWSAKYYQYTNRLAHLYFLREKCKKNAFLVNFYFIGDKTVFGPNTIEEWDTAIKRLYSFLGLSQHKLSKYIIDIFIDYNNLKK